MLLFSTNNEDNVCWLVLIECLNSYHARATEVVALYWWSSKGYRTLAVANEVKIPISLFSLCALCFFFSLDWGVPHSFNSCWHVKNQATLDFFLQGQTCLCLFISIERAELKLNSCKWYQSLLCPILFRVLPKHYHRPEHDKAQSKRKRVNSLSFLK